MIERADKNDRSLPIAKAESGYGASAGDIKRGSTDPGEMDSRGRDLQDHKHRSTEPKPRSVAPDPANWMADWERRANESKSKGFLTRPAGGHGFQSER